VGVFLHNKSTAFQPFNRHSLSTDGRLFTYRYTRGEQLAKKWTHDDNVELAELVEKHGRKWRTVQEKLSKRRSIDQIRKHYERYVSVNATRVNKLQSNPIENAKNRRIHKFLPNGQEYSEIIVPKEALQTRESLLIAHGYNPDEFEITGSTSNYWDMPNKENVVITLYQSKINVKPKTIITDWNELNNRLVDKVKPRTAKPHITNHSDQYLVIPIFDMHFGNNTLEDYDVSLGKILTIMKNDNREILIIAGGDQLHNDNHRGTTSSGTVIDKVDMTQAWEDAFDFLDIIIDKALDSAETVNVMYVPGNHDEMTGQTLFKALEKVYRDEDRLHIDSEHRMFKATLLGHNFIGASHGDKSNKNKYPMIYATSFSQLWGKESVITREVFVGHLHHESVIDKDGLVIRQAPTRNKADQYHEDNGFNSAHKRFSVVAYDEYEPTAVHYI